MNLMEVLAALVGAARKIGAEKVLISRFDLQATPYLRVTDCEDPFIDRVFPVIPGEAEVEEPMFYATDAVAPGWAVFVAGGSVNFKDLSEWVKPADGGDHVKA
jgi:hypothetical protein